MARGSSAPPATGTSAPSSASASRPSGADPSAPSTPSVPPTSSPASSTTRASSASASPRRPCSARWPPRGAVSTARTPSVPLRIAKRDLRHDRPARAASGTREFQEVPRARRALALHTGLVTRIGAYEVERELGRGGMGVVYLAREPGLNRPVALKLLLGTGAEEAARFCREALALAALRHRNIVSVHAADLHRGRPWIAMDWVEGESLAARVAREGPLPEPEAARIAAELADALAAAHRRGLLHRDVKPANVLLRAHDGRVLLTDFGLARGAENARERLTRTGQLLGTPSYMAPEQVEGDPVAVGPAVDVYGLGATLYHCLTGKPPFAAKNPLALLRAVLERSPLPPARARPGLDPDLNELCLACLEKEPARRPTSAAALRDELERFLAGEPLRLRRSGPARWARSLWRRPAHTALAALCLLSLGALGAAGLRVRSPADREAERAARRADERRRAQREAARCRAELRRRADEVEARSRARRLERLERSVQRSLRSARERIAARRFAEAIEVLREQERALGEQAEALRSRGDDRSLLERAQTLRREVRRALADALYRAGTEHGALRSDRPGVRERLDEVLTFDPEHLEALCRRAALPAESWGAGKPSVAWARAILADTERALRLGGADPSRWGPGEEGSFRKADVLASRASALAWLEGLGAKEGSRAQGIALAREAVALQDRIAAYAEGRQGLDNRVRKTLAELLLGRARGSGSREHYAAARDAFSYALELGPDYRALRMRAECRLALGDLAGAEADARRAVELKPDYAAGRETLARIRARRR
ncbi:MAG: hypothetical protein D6731_02805 [Planctomycetota bacterium]|nr:MAG: hypothetical protein D6731_02805 [Planctomycetota bacterium]